MLRTFTAEGFVLLTDRFGEIHRRLTFFTAERGLVSLIAHGALKPTGKLKSITELFSHSRFTVYADPVKDSQKITEGECLQSFPGFRSSLIRFYSASLVAEIVLKSFGGGEARQTLFALVHDALYLLHTGPEEEAGYLVIQFILRFLGLVGFEWNTKVCAACRKEISENENAYLLRRGRGFVCPPCRERDLAGGTACLLPGARKYAAHSLGIPLADAVNIRLSGRALTELKAAVYLMAQESLERPLNTLEAARGVL